MPSLKTIGEQAAATASKLHSNFEAVWSVLDPSKVTHDGQGLYSYTGAGGTSENIGTIRTIRPLDPQHKTGMSTLEVAIVDPGKHNYIAIGVCNEAYPTNCLPGWKPISVGYHADDGSLFISSDQPTPTSAPCKKGDVIQCTVLTYPGDPSRIIIQFFKNGDKITQVPMPEPPGGLYGVIGMMGGGEKVLLSAPVVTKKPEFDQLWEVSTPLTIQLAREGVCTYTGAGDFTHDSIGTVRAKHPVDLSGPLDCRSFELRIIEPGQHKYIGIGVVCRTYPANKLPGWKEISVGYHADNGDLFHSCEEGKPTDQPCVKGDIMRCTVEAIDKGKEVAVLFHRNGEQVGRVTSWKPEEGFYFCFGMMSRDEKVQVILPEVSEPYCPEIPSPPLEESWALNPNMKHKGDGVCHYVKTDSDDNVGTIRSKAPLDPFGQNNYFDVKIIDPGEKSFIALGVCSEHYPTHRLPGWDDLSVGFHIDDGSILMNTLDPKKTGVSCGKGDVVRCSIKPVDKHDKQVNVMFQRNGKLLGNILFWKPGKGGFFAQIGCMSNGEVIQVASFSTSPSSLSPDIQGVSPNKMYQSSPLESQQSVAAPSVSRILSTHPSQSESVTSMISNFGEGQGGVSGLSLASGHHEGHGDHPDLHVPGDKGSAAAMGGGGASFNPFFPPRMPHPHHGVLPHFPPPSFHGTGHHDPHDPHVHLYHKWMQWHQSHYYSPHGFHGYPHLDAASESDREGTNITPEAKADTSSPWRFPHPYPPWGAFSSFHPFGGATFRGTGHHPSPVRPELSEQVSQMYRDFAKQVSVASSASDAAPPGFSRENSTEMSPSGKEDSLGGTVGLPSSSASFNKMTLSDKHSSLPQFIPQTSDASMASSSSQQFSDDHLAGAGAGAAAGTCIQCEPEPKKLLSKKKILVEDDKSKAHTESLPGEGETTPECTDDQSDLANTPVLEDAHTSESSAAVAVSTSESSSATDVTPTNSMDLPQEVDGDEVKSQADDAPQRPLHTLRSNSYSQQQESVVIIPKETNKMFQVLHNVDFTGDNSFVRTVLDDDLQMGNSFVMCRLPLSEKMPYFEVEIQYIADNSQAAACIGLVWENYPIYHLPGMLPGSIGLHNNGSLRAGNCSRGESTCQPITSALVSGDVIGCQAHLCYKSEVSDPESKDGNLVEVEFFKNGLSLAVQDVILPPNGLHPAVGFIGQGTSIKLNQSIQLTPKCYFKTCANPRNFVNFTPPTALYTGWRCLKNTTVREERNLTINEPHSGIPAVVQHSLPFSEKNFYFEVELRCHVSAFSVLSIGALPQKSSSEVSTFIPGEAASSIGFLPLIGFIMRNGRICSTIPEAITSSLYGERTTIGVGIDFRKEVHDLDTSMSEGDVTSEDRVLVFFTINGQVMSSVFATAPKGGFYPTLAVDSDSDPSSGLAVTIKFPHPWPKVDNLPYGFVRGAENGFVLKDAHTVIDAKGGSNATALPVRALQAAAPLSRSHPYFEVRIMNGGGTYRISIGLASSTYELFIHPGWKEESIAFHADDGRLFINGSHEAVVPPCHFKGTILGCGARFPDDGTVRFAEVYFTVNNCIIARRFVRVPHLGFFPTIGMRTKGGSVTIDLNAPDPCAGMKFNTLWGTTENMKIEGDVFSVAPNLVRVKRGAALLSLPLCTMRKHVVYYKIAPLSEIEGTIMFGITTNKLCPQNFCESQPSKCSILNIANGKVTIYDKYFQTKESCVIKDTKEFGCGLKPLPVEKSYILFFTCDEQVVFCSPIEVDSDEVYPIIMMMDTTTRLRLDACALWPNMTPIGPGWARFANLKFENSILSHSAVAAQPTRKKLPVGFAQAAMPLNPTHPYFEIEVISRTANKAIAIGLASRRYPSNSWVGWHDESIAYHLDDGRLFKSFKLGHSFGPKAYATDTVGCGVRFEKVPLASALKGGDTVEVFFTINGAIIGTQKMTIPCGGAFPTICLESPTESVIYHHHYEMFPPLSRLIDSRIWCNAYSVCQADRQIKHLCRYKDICGGLPKAFCQAKEPFSPGNSYFELEIIGLEPNSVIQLGLSALIPHGCTSPNTHSVLYSTAGQMLLRKNDQKTILGTQKSGLGDKLGCALVYRDGKPTSADFFINNIKISSRNLDWNARLQTTVLYPTIVLTHPGDAVIPNFHIPPPVSDTPFLVGWLRMERVKVKGALVEYTAAGKTLVDVGVAQASQALNFNSFTYYEIEILDPGQKCTISIGVAASDYSLNNQPGWRENSAAVHGDDGRLFQNSGMGTAFGPAWKKYDIIGLGIRSPTNNCLPYSKVQVYFTHNGEEIGHTSQIVPPSGLFPTIGMHSQGEKVKIHIGTQEAQPSSYDPIRMEWDALCGVDIKKSPDGRHVLSYNDYNRSRPDNLEHGIILSVAVGRQPLSEDMQYFEVEICSKGHMGIAVGVVPTGYPLQEAPGWSRGSLAYHTDNGGLYNSSLKGRDFGPVPHVGDVIGCGVELVPNTTKFCFVFFTYNGFVIGRIRASLPEKGFHPGLALTSINDKIAVHFMETFKPRVLQLDSSFIGVMRINNCSYTHQIVQFTGTGNSGYTQSPAMAQFAVPLHHDRRYFAANIVRSKDVILIGLAVKDYPMKYAPGFTSISIAYNIQKGSIKAVYGPDNFVNLEAPVCKVGDTVGCGISLNESESKDDAPGNVFFTKNGALIKSVPLIELMEDLYPVVGFIPEEKSSAVFMDWNVTLFEPVNRF